MQPLFILSEFFNIAKFLNLLICSEKPNLLQNYFNLVVAVKVS